MVTFAKSYPANEKENHCPADCSDFVFIDRCHSDSALLGKEWHGTPGRTV
jgi:hypothetical protein